MWVPSVHSKAVRLLHTIVCMQVSRTIQQARFAVRGRFRLSNLRSAMSPARATVSQAFVEMVPALDGVDPPSVDKVVSQQSTCRHRVQHMLSSAVLVVDACILSVSMSASWSI